MSKKMKTVLAAILLVAAGAAACFVLMQPDDRNAVQKLGDAIEAMPQGADKAARALEDRTTGERLMDKVRVDR